jgi:hypothetical protein
MGVSFFHTVQSFAQFLMNFTLSGGKLVDQNTANQRADICKGCHNNKPTDEVRTSICNSCNKMGSMVLNQLRSTIIKNNATTGDSGLLTCGICGCDNRISVWIPNHNLLAREDAFAYPTFCWKKKILENTEI